MDPSCGTTEKIGLRRWDSPGMVDVNGDDDLARSVEPLLMGDELADLMAEVVLIAVGPTLDDLCFVRLTGDD
jgi:hypothetical protein